MRVDDSPLYHQDLTMIADLASREHLRDYLTILLFITLCASAIKFLIDSKRFIELAFKLPGPRAYPVVGNALKFACSSEQLLERIVEVISPYKDKTPIRLWMGPSLYIVIAEPRDIEIILNSQQATNKGDAYRFMYPFIGEGLISGSGRLWKAHRKLLSYIINQRILDDFIGVFDRYSKRLVKKLNPVANGEIFDIFYYVECCTIDLVCDTVMGNPCINALDDSDHEFIHRTAEMYKIIHNRMMKIWLYPDWIFRMTSNYTKQYKAQQAIHDFTEKCIETKKKEISDGKTGVSILERLLVLNDTKKELSNEELRDEIYTIYIAAQDTLAVTSSFCLLMMGIHENVQEKAITEIDEIIGDGEINAESLPKLKYVEMIVKETLRLFPIAPLLVRRLNGEIKLERCVLPKDSQVVLVSYAAHRSSKSWFSPDKFIPERFAADESLKRHPYAFFPFSGGPMGCIGQKYAMMALKTILANILKKYSIKSNLSLDDIKLKTDISIRSKVGYKISLQTRRNDTA